MKSSHLALLCLFASATPLLAKPDLDAKDLKVNDRTPDPGDLITCSWTAINRTGDYVRSTEQGVLLSTSKTVKRSGSGVTLLGKEGLGPLGGWLKDTSPEIKTVKLPNNLVPGKTYYISVWADYDRERSESNETNNGSNAVSITVRGPDLVAESLTAGVDLAPVLAGGGSTTVTAAPGQLIHLDWTARNRGAKGTGGTQQGIFWSTDKTIDSKDTQLRREYLGPLPDGWKTEENATVAIPSNARTGQTYYIAVKADVESDERETNESNNTSNTITIRVEEPWTAQVDLYDYNYLPYLEDDDERLSDRDSDGKVDEGVVMNRSRTFAPGDAAYIRLTVEERDFDFTDLFASGTLRMSAYYNSQPVESGRTAIASPHRFVTKDLKSGAAELQLKWIVPNTPGNYYVQAVVEVQKDNGWEVLSKEWIDGGSAQDPIRVSKETPIILVHGWSDTSGETFRNLEMLLECDLGRPVRFFQYETSELATNNGPRVDEGYQEIFGGVSKPSLAQQLKEFLGRPEGSGGSLAEVDIIAHSMGGLVARNYALLGTKIRRLVTLGTPSYGGIFADSFDWVLNNQAEDLEFGCELSWKLHREWTQRRDAMPDVLAVVGTDDALPGKYNQSDSLVRCSSASLENLGYPVYYVPRGHTGGSGMAKVDDLAHESWPAIRDFLTRATPAVADGRPGHQSGADDVGHRSHRDPLPGGAAYLVGLDASNRLRPLPEVTVIWTDGVVDVPFRRDTHESGIYSIVGRDGDQKAIGSRGYTDWTVRFPKQQGGFASQSIRIMAGETTVLVVDENGNIIDLAPEDTKPSPNPNPNPVDSDGDLLPDVFELAIIAANAFDAIRSLSDVTADTDFDGDGLSEIFELAFGLNPLLKDARDIVSTRLEAGQFVLRHPNVAQGVALKLLGQASPDLQNWSPANVTGPTIRGGFTEWSIPTRLGSQFIKLVAEKQD